MSNRETNSVHRELDISQGGSGCDRVEFEESQTPESNSGSRFLLGLGFWVLTEVDDALWMQR